MTKIPTRANDGMSPPVPLRVLLFTQVSTAFIKIHVRGYICDRPPYIDIADRKLVGGGGGGGAFR